jgi:cobalt-zinc-cadmium efflux system outer membrane protein
VQGIHLLSIGLLCSAAIFSNAQAGSLREALDHAWATQANQLGARDAQYAAQVAASQAWTPEPPSVGLFNSTDQFNSDYGRREWEVGVSTPIWLPGQRDQAEAVAHAEQSAFGGRSALNRWQLAGLLRESWWAVRFAEVDVRIASRQLDEAEQLAKDVGLRVKAGDLAPLDANQASSRVQQAKQQQGSVKLALQQARQAFVLASRGAALPDQAETLATPPALELHPLLSSLQDATRSAQTRLEQATGDSRDAPELALSYTNERDESGADYRGRIKLGITVPFGSESRNQPRITAANADWIEAQSQGELERERIAAEIANARLELGQSQEQLSLADEQLKLAKQSTEWVAKGFRLGQFDLSTQIRSQQEQLLAEAQLARSKHAVARAISRFNQAAGVLP